MIKGDRTARSRSTLKATHYNCCDSNKKSPADA